MVMRSEGASLRDIAEAAKLTHTGVRRILKAAGQHSHGPHNHGPHNHGT